MNASTCELLFDPHRDPNLSPVIWFGDIIARWLDEINDPDVSGVGILAAFTFSACFHWVLAVALWACGLVAGEQLTAVDRRLYRIKTRRMPRIEKALVQTMKTLSDQQIVTGIAILVAAIGRVNSLSVYHWKVIVSLGWLSSNVHILTLSTLRPLLSQNRGIMIWRVFGMLVLFVLVLIVLLPTRTLAFSSKWSILRYVEPEWPLTPRVTGSVVVLVLPGTASCFWHQASWQTEPYGRSFDIFWAGSVAFLLLAYVWKFGQLLLKNSPKLLASCFQLPRRIFMHLLHQSARRMTQCPNMSHKLQYWIILIPYLLIRSFWDLAESLVATIGILSISLSWGLMRLWESTSWPVRQGFKEDEWTFGQLVAVMICVLPVFLLFEQLWGPGSAKQTSAGTLSAPDPPATQGTPLLSTVLAREDPNELLLGRWTGRTAAAIENSLYSSKLYKALLILYQVMALGQAVEILFFGSYADMTVTLQTSEWNVVLLVFMIFGPTIGFLGLPPLLLVVAAPFSKVFR